MRRGITSNDSGRIARMQLRRNEPWFDEAFKAFQKFPTTQQEFDAYIKTITPFFFSSTANLEKNRDEIEKTTFSRLPQLRGRGNPTDHRLDPATFLPTMKIPALVIVGDDDFICPPAAAEYLHREIPN